MFFLRCSVWKTFLTQTIQKEKKSKTNENHFFYLVPKPVQEEPEKIKRWREEQKQRLEEKDREEELKKTELREQARKELEDWYKHHEESIGKTKATNRWVSELRTK